MTIPLAILLATLTGFHGIRTEDGILRLRAHTSSPDTWLRPGGWTVRITIGDLLVLIPDARALGRDEGPIYLHDSLCPLISTRCVIDDRWEGDVFIPGDSLAVDVSTAFVERFGVTWPASVFLEVVPLPAPVQRFRTVVP